MNSSGDFTIENFQLLVENYEAALSDITGDINCVQSEQIKLKQVLSENNKLREELNKVLAEKSLNESTNASNNLSIIENLRLQLKVITDEKNQAIQLWQNATNAVEKLENDLVIYQENTGGYIPKSKLTELQTSYEEKLSDLQKIVTKTKHQLEETISLNSKELRKDKAIDSLQTHKHTITIIKNLEEEVLNLQERLKIVNNDKSQLQKEVKNKDEESTTLKNNIKECKAKVEEALQVVEAALNEKDAALLREAEAKDNSIKLSQNIQEIIQETEAKITELRNEYEVEIQNLKETLRASQEMVDVQDSEIDNYNKRCVQLETELENTKKTRFSINENTHTKILSLERNLEDTFQKLLLSEKLNIKLKSEIDSIKNDLQQMSHLYERDVNVRETEKVVLKKEITRLKSELDTSTFQVSHSSDVITNLNNKISALETDFKEQIEETKNSFQQTCKERKEMEEVHNEIVQELQDQLNSQADLNKKWRNETKNITDQLETVITQLKIANSKIKQDNKILGERLKEANFKMFEYRKFLEMISHDVSKITTVTVPDFGDVES